MKSQPVGIFDSGVGGLSVAVEIRRLLPRERLLYYADCARAPWGVRPPEEVCDLSGAVAAHLLARGAKVIVAACNTASIHSLAFLRARFPDVRFVGIVPAVKPAAEKTRTGQIGVMVTSATARGQALADLLQQFVYSRGVEPHVVIPQGLVEQVERGELDSPSTRAILAECLCPLLEKNVDALALGCTHFPFVADLIREVVGDQVHLINPAPAVAAQCARVLEAEGLLNDGPEPDSREALQVLTAGDQSRVRDAVFRILGHEVPVRYDDALHS